MVIESQDDEGRTIANGQDGEDGCQDSKLCVRLKSENKYDTTYEINIAATRSLL